MLFIINIEITAVTILSAASVSIVAIATACSKLNPILLNNTTTVDEAFPVNPP